MTALATPPKLQFLDSNGAPLVGGKLYTYAAGTTTPQVTYTDFGGGTPNANPVILDSRGEASVWLGTALYKMALYSATDVLIWTVDNIGGFATLAQLAASGGSNLIGFLPAGTGAVATTVQSKLRESVSVLDFGAVGDGVTDDTTAFQAAFDAARTLKCDVCIPATANGYVWGSSSSVLYLDGQVSVTGIGNPIIKVANGTLKGASNKISLAIGTLETWSGTLSGLHFQQHTGFSSQLLMNVFAAENYAIDNNTFTLFSFGATMIKGVNDSAWHTGSFRKNGKYRGNVIDVPGGYGVAQEGISVSANGSALLGYWAENIEMSGNTVIGVGDDPLAMHGVSGGFILNNYCDTFDGRIFVSDSVDICIDNNFITHNQLAGPSASLIQCTLESSNASIARECRNISITNNKLRISALEANVVEAIYLQAGANIVISGNSIYSDNATYGGNINIAPVTHLAVARNTKDITVVNNTIYGGRITATANLTGNLNIKNNIIDGRSLISDLLYVDPNVLTTNRLIYVEGNQLLNPLARLQFIRGNDFSDVIKLCSFSTTGVVNVQKQMDLQGSSINTWQSPRMFVITEAIIRTSTTSGAGSFLAYVYLNGVLWVAGAETKTFSMGTTVISEYNTQRDGETSAAERYMSRYIHDEDTLVRVDFRNSGTAPAVDATVDLYGYFLNR